MKKIKFFERGTAALALAALVAVSMLAGCTDQGGGTSDGAGDSAGTTAAETTAAEISSASAKVTVEGTKFMVDGKELWINGVNTPWQNWNDFGGSAFEPEFWDSHFSDLHDIGVNSVRVWINCNSMVGIKLKTTGEVKEVLEKHWQDVDQLFEIAEKHQIYVMPTLLSFDHCKDTNYADRWRAVITDETAMQSYIDNYVKPFAERYGSNPYMLGIDLMNEPDWVHENDECGKLSLDSLSNFFAKCTAAIHETNPDTLVTVGMGMIKYNSDKGNCSGNIISDEIMKTLGGDKACLDFYSVHYYDWMKSNWGSAFEASPADYGLDMSKPVFLGEIGTSTPLKDVYQSCYDLGWNGVMMWCSNNGAEHADNWADIEAATKNMETAAGDKVFPTGKK